MGLGHGAQLVTLVRVTLVTCHVNTRDIVTFVRGPGGDDGGEVGGRRLKDVDPGTRGGRLGGQGGHGASGEAGGQMEAGLTLHRDVDHGGARVT